MGAEDANRALEGVASWITSHRQPSIADDMKTALGEIGPWLVSRIWPGRYPLLENAFDNFRLVAQDFRNEFEHHAIKVGADVWQTEKFYKIPGWNEERYKALAEQFHAHVALVEDLMLELTRAANYVCDRVREFVLRSYRIRDGAILIDSGLHMDMTVKTCCVEYRGEERSERRYPSLAKFETVRLSRDRSFAARPTE